MTTRTRPSCRATPPDPTGPVPCASPRGRAPSRGRHPDRDAGPSSIQRHRSLPSLSGRGRARHAAAPIGEGHDMRNIIRIGAGTDGRNRFVAIALGVALAARRPVPPRSPRPARAPALPSPWPDYSPWPGPPCSRPWPAPAAMARTLTVSRPTDEAILRPAHAPAEALYDNSGTVWASWTSSSAPHPSAFSRPASRPATAFRCACAPCYFLIPGCTNLDRSRPATA